MRFAAALVALLACPVLVHAGETLSLDAEEPDASVPFPRSGLLVREIARQAVLLGARDELGLATRDRALGEPLDTTEPGYLRLATAASTGSRTITLVLRKGEAVVHARDYKLKLTRRSEVDYGALVTELEKLSRGELVAALRSAGFTGEAHKAAKAAALPKDIEERLARLNLWDQFVAVRETHALIARSGECSERLVGLVRGYANLGLLADGHWTASHKVFKARALLYAERLFYREIAEGTDTARYWRAYARALAGLHSLALEDLRKSDSVGAPEPVMLAFHFAMAHREDLAKVDAASPNAPLARFLEFLTYEDSIGVKRTFDAGLALLGVEPECYRTVDVLCKVGGVSSNHRWTIAGLETLERSIPERVDALPGLPDSVKARAKRGIPAAVAALVGAGKPGADDVDPSWTVLGRLIEETAFLQVYRRVRFMAEQWSVPVGEFLEAAKPLYSEHRYGGYIEAFGYPAGSARRQKLLGSLEPVDANYDMSVLLRAIGEVSPERMQKSWRLAFQHNDQIERDQRLVVLSEQATKDGEGRNTEIARRNVSVLQETSPASPLAYARSVTLNWGSVAPVLSKVETQVGGDPTFLDALARHYAAAGDTVAAAKCWKRLIAASPEAYAFRNLAAIHAKQGDMDAWKETLDAYLEQPDRGLEHARVRCDIANYFMARKQWAKAIPYADAAAETWAEWAMRCASQCHEGAGDLPNAELWIRRVSERYEGTELDWFFWCKRVGAGDLDAAYAHAEPLVKALAANDEADLRDRSLVARFYLLAGRPKRALAAMKALAEATHSPVYSLHVAILAKTKEERAAALEDAIEKGKDAPGETGELSALAKVLRPCWEDIAAYDADAVAALREKTPEANRSRLDYFLARFLEERGERAKAASAYEQCLADPAEGDSLARQLARDGLARVSAEKKE